MPDIGAAWFLIFWTCITSLRKRLNLKEKLITVQKAVESEDTLIQEAVESEDNNQVCTIFLHSEIVTSSLSYFYQDNATLLMIWSRPVIFVCYLRAYN